jgi:hypothetical protein
MEPDDTTRPAGHPTATEPRRGVPRVLVGAAVLLAVVAVSLTLLAGAVDRLNPFRDGLFERRTIDRSGPAVVRAISDLGELRAASGYYELVVDVQHETGPLPSILVGDRTLFVAAGTVEAGVDLRDLPEDAVRVNGDRTTATIELPPPRLSPPRLDVRRSYVASRQRGIVDRLQDAATDADDTRELYALADRRLAEAAAATPELRTRAETNTRAMLRGLLRSLGFTDVTVTFTGSSGSD